MRGTKQTRKLDAPSPWCSMVFLSFSQTSQLFSQPKAETEFYRDLSGVQLNSDPLNFIAEVLPPWTKPLSFLTYTALAPMVHSSCGSLFLPPLPAPLDFDN